MKSTRSLVCAGIALTLFATSALCLAQPASPGYHWQPLAEAMVKDGREEGWSVNVNVNVAAMPFGSDMPYQGVTVDVFPSLDAAFAEDKQFVDRFTKVHPDMELGTTFERVQKLRSQAEVHLYELEEFVAAAH
jgi:hypothetical protein